MVVNKGMVGFSIREEIGGRNLFGLPDYLSQFQMTANVLVDGGQAVPAKDYQQSEKQDPDCGLH